MCCFFRGRSYPVKKSVAISGQDTRTWTWWGWLVVRGAPFYVSCLQFLIKLNSFKFQGTLLTRVHMCPPTSGWRNNHHAPPPHLQRNVIDLDIIRAPLPEELDVWGLCYCRCSCLPLRHPRDRKSQSQGTPTTDSEDCPHSANLEVIKNHGRL